MARNLGGRPTIFGPKSPVCRYQGTTSEDGSMFFEQARARLAALVGWEPQKVGDGDVMEYLARGEVRTREYLAQK